LVFLPQRQPPGAVHDRIAGSQQVVVVFNAGTPPSYQITVRWDEPTPDGSVPQYSINVPVNPF
jgi:hypothetical protein